MSEEISINAILNPCPFCGGKATAFLDNYNKIAIMCENCDLYFGIELECGEELVDGWRAKIDTAYAAVMRWNERANGRGKWVRSNSDCNFIVCSKCGHEAYWDTDYGQQLFDYCPYCGKRMMKGGDTECQDTE